MVTMTSIVYRIGARCVAIDNRDVGVLRRRVKYRSGQSQEHMYYQHTLESSIPLCTALYCMRHLNQPCVAPPRKRQKTSAAQLAPASSLSVAEDTSPTDTGVLYGLGETTVEESDTYYVTDMHTGRVMRSSGPGAYYRARSRMVAGLYFRPDMPDIIFRGGRLATQNGKGGLVTEVAPLKDPPGGLGLSVESFELCCRCSRPGCNAEVFTPAARGVRRRPEHLRLARERHKRAHPGGESLCHGPPNYCLYLRCERCSLGMGNQQARESGGAAAAGAALVGLGGFSKLYGV